MENFEQNHGSFHANNFMDSWSIHPQVSQYIRAIFISRTGVFKQAGVLTATFDIGCNGAAELQA